MYQINEFSSRTDLDQNLADKVADILAKAVASKGRASIAVSVVQRQKASSKRYQKKPYRGVILPSL